MANVMGLRAHFLVATTVTVNPYEQRLLSRPVTVHWAGWTSDTYRLQQNGWSLSAHQDIARMQLGLAMRHERYGAGLSAPIEWHYMEDQFWDTGQHRLQPELHMDVLARPLTMNVMGAPNYATYNPIDAVPQMQERRTGRIEDFIHFAPSLARTQEIIIPEDNVDDLLERILKLQQPARTERLRDQMRNPEGLIQVPRQKFHAQILSLVA